MFFETLRLEIRQWTSEDIEVFTALLADPEVMRFSLRGPLSREDAKSHFQKRILDHYKAHGFGLMALVHKEEKNVIGFAGLITQEVDEEEKIELAYRIFPAYWGKGLAYEAVQLICDYAFSELQLKEVVSIIEPENIRSVKLAERIGMKPLKQTFFHHIPVTIYARSPDSYS